MLQLDRVHNPSRCEAACNFVVNHPDTNMDTAPRSFTVMVTGQIESAEIPSCSNGYCKFEFVAGEDWTLTPGGLQSGITQLARPAFGPDQQLVWNFPLDVTYQSTNAFGWPQLVVSCHGVDALGRDMLQGYGCIHLPTCAGRYSLKVRLFKPRSASLLQTLTGWITGMPAEFIDPRFPAYSEGREVTRVVSCGYVTVQVNVLTKDMAAFGYTDGSSRDQGVGKVVKL